MRSEVVYFCSKGELGLWFCCDEGYNVVSSTGFNTRTVIAQDLWLFTFLPSSDHSKAESLVPRGQHYWFNVAVGQQRWDRTALKTTLFAWPLAKNISAIRSPQRQLLSSAMSASSHLLEQKSCQKWMPGTLRECFRWFLGTFQFAGENSVPKSLESL